MERSGKRGNIPNSTPDLVKDEELELSPKIPARMREVDLGFHQDMGCDPTVWGVRNDWNLSWSDPGGQMGTGGWTFGKKGQKCWFGNIEG